MDQIASYYDLYIWAPAHIKNGLPDSGDRVSQRLYPIILALHTLILHPLPTLDLDIKVDDLHHIGEHSPLC
jgi:hypothetical protein